MKKKLIEIGVVSVLYSPTWNVLDASFEPTMKHELDEKCLTQLKSISSDKDKDVIKSNAELVFASWFEKMNEIELADREKFEIVSRVLTKSLVEADKNWRVKILFSFKER